MKQNEAPLLRTFDGLSRQQLFIYARELGEHFWKEHDLHHTLSERERQIRKLTATAIAAQEEERQWIAYEVHDRIAQTLASVFQQLQALEAMTEADSQTYQVAVRASVLLRDAIRESQNIMNDLHPPGLDEFGIVPLIKQELRHFQEATGCRAKLDADYPVRPSQDVEVALYRVFHEALVNVRRHASGVRNVTVTLRGNGHTISLHIQDDGPGFDVKAAMRSQRVGGLMSMRRRAEVVGGAFEVMSIPCQGTRVTIRVPVDGDSKGEPER